MTFAPVAKPAGCVDVAGVADVDQPASPRAGALLGEFNFTVGVIAAGHHNARTGKPLPRYGSETHGLGWKARPARVRNRHEEGSCNGDRSSRQPMSHHQASQAVRGNQHARRSTLSCNLQRSYPIGTDGILPVSLVHANMGIVLRFPAALPMLGAGIAYAGYEEYAVSGGVVSLSWFGHTVMLYMKDRSGLLQ